MILNNPIGSAFTSIRLGAKTIKNRLVRVRLYEKRPEAGGAFLLASKAPHKDIF